MRKEGQVMNHIQPQFGKRLRLFLGDAEVWQGQPLSQAVLEVARQYGVLAVTVTRGIEGFGPEHHLSTDRLPDLSNNLPLIIEILDTEERIEGLLPLLDPLVQRGMMTLTPVEIITGGRSQ
jgi:PII-like signaling protein